MLFLLVRSRIHADLLFSLHANMNSQKSRLNTNAAHASPG